VDGQQVRRHWFNSGDGGESKKWIWQTKKASPMGGKGRDEMDLRVALLPSGRTMQITQAGWRSRLLPVPTLIRIMPRADGGKPEIFN
jgi:hypothetical protein